MLGLSEAVKLLHFYPFCVNGGNAVNSIGGGVSGNVAGGFGVRAAYNFGYYVLY